MIVDLTEYQCDLLLVLLRNHKEKCIEPHWELDGQRWVPGKENSRFAQDADDLSQKLEGAK